MNNRLICPITNVAPLLPHSGRMCCWTASPITATTTLPPPPLSAKTTSYCKTATCPVCSVWKLWRRASPRSPAAMRPTQGLTDPPRLSARYPQAQSVCRLHTAAHPLIGAGTRIDDGQHRLRRVRLLFALDRRARTRTAFIACRRFVDRSGVKCL